MVDNANFSRIGRISGPGEHDPSRPEEEYGNTPDFAAAREAVASGTARPRANRNPGKCFNCSKSLGPGAGEVVHVSKIPQEKRRGAGNWGVRCTGESCLDKSGKVKGSGTRESTPAQGVKFQKALIGKAGGGKHRISVEHPPNSGQVSSIVWHPRSGVESVTQHPEHDNEVIDFLKQTAGSESARQGTVAPRPRKPRGKKK